MGRTAEDTKSILATGWTIDVSDVAEGIAKMENSIRSMQAEMLEMCIRDSLTAIEQELEAKLFRDGCFAEFDESELTRGDTKTRGDFYRIARGSMQEPGFMTTNEIRAAEGLPPVPGEMCIRDRACTARG